MYIDGLEKTTNVKLLKKGVEINGSKFYEGQKVKIKDLETGEIVDGTIKFGVYSDGEACYDYYHLGWWVYYKIEIYSEYYKKPIIAERIKTLIDAFACDLIVK